MTENTITCEASLNDDGVVTEGTATWNGRVLSFSDQAQTAGIHDAGDLDEAFSVLAPLLEYVEGGVTVDIRLIPIVANRERVGTLIWTVAESLANAAWVSVSVDTIDELQEIFPDLTEYAFTATELCLVADSEPLPLFAPCPYGLTHYGLKPLATEEQLDELNSEVDDAIGQITQTVEGIGQSVEDIDDEIASLQEAVAAKQDVLTAGQNITIENNVISASGGSGGAQRITTVADLRQAIIQGKLVAICLNLQLYESLPSGMPTDWSGPIPDISNVKSYRIAVGYRIWGFVQNCVSGSGADQSVVEFPPHVIPKLISTQGGGMEPTLITVSRLECTLKQDGTNGMKITVGSQTFAFNGGHCVKSDRASYTPSGTTTLTLTDAILSSPMGASSLGVHAYLLA